MCLVGVVCVCVVFVCVCVCVCWSGTKGEATTTFPLAIGSPLPFLGHRHRAVATPRCLVVVACLPPSSAFLLRHLISRTGKHVNIKKGQQVVSYKNKYAQFKSLPCATETQQQF